MSATAIAAPAPELEREAARRAAIAAYTDYAERQPGLPDCRDFAELFTLSEPGNSPDHPFTDQLSGYLRVRTAAGGQTYLLHVEPTPLLVDYIGAVMSPEWQIGFQIIIMADGFARVFAEYGKIIGGRWLTLIEAASIPGRDLAVPPPDPGRIHQPAPPRPVVAVADDALGVLGRAVVEGNLIRLTDGTLDRLLYQQVDKILQLMGGKWDRTAKAHRFPTDPSDLLDSVLMTGTIQKPEKFGYFPTPPALARAVVAKAELFPGCTVFEPSAGTGGLADIIHELEPGAHITCNEFQAQHCATLQAKGYAVRQGDFLAIAPAPDYDRVIMNPPFERQQDIIHVNHAWQFVRPGGILVAIMGAGVTFRDSLLAREFRSLIAACGSLEDNPAGCFKASGTNVKSVTVRLVKPH